MGSKIVAHIFRFLGVWNKDSSWTVEGEEFVHMRKVLRLKEGTSVEVVDGNGRVALGNITRISKNSATIVGNSTFFPRAVDHRLTICLGALRRNTLEDLLPSLVELGVDQLIIFNQNQLAKFRLSEKVYLRLNRIIVSAFKQSKRAWITQLTFAENFDKLGQFVSDYDQKLVLSPNGAQLIRSLNLMGKVVIVIGSEKGLTELELENLRKEGFVTVKFCDTILTSKTAIISAAAYMAASLC